MVLVLQTCGLTYVRCLGCVQSSGGRPVVWDLTRGNMGEGRNSAFGTIAMEDIEAQRLGDKPTNDGIIRLPGPTPLSRWAAISGLFETAQGGCLFPTSFWNLQLQQLWPILSMMNVFNWQFLAFPVGLSEHVILCFSSFTQPQVYNLIRSSHIWA